METKELLKNELKRLSRRNDLLEKELNEGQFSNLPVNELIKDNTLAMCEIAKVLKSF